MSTLTKVSGILLTSFGCQHSCKEFEIGYIQDICVFLPCFTFYASKMYGKCGLSKVVRLTSACYLCKLPHQCESSISAALICMVSPKLLHVMKCTLVTCCVRAVFLATCPDCSKKNL